MVFIRFLFIFAFVQAVNNI